MTNEQYSQTAQKMAKAAGVVKLICGVANNAAWMVVLDGYNHARRCRRYRHDVKRAFKDAIKALHIYERNLIYARENRMFHLADMSEQARKTYGNITDREYYDFWASVGGPAYEKTHPLITSLWNKLRLSLLNHGVDDAANVAWVLTAQATLELAEQLYEKAISECKRSYQLPEMLLRKVFSQFSLKRVSEAWRKALKMLAPESQYDLSSLERRNIELGLTQLCEAWLDPSLLYNSTMQSVEDYKEIFRTTGEHKKAMREIAEVRDETMEELENESQGT